MPIQPSIQANFIGGLKTEATGLNFPENACTATENCVFSLIGDVYRRQGINFESGFAPKVIQGAESAMTTFLWKNAGGDGLSEILVVQVGNMLYFYLSSASTAASPISNHYINSPVAMSAFQAVGNTSSLIATECQYAAGNGYLFVFHPSCDPFYCTYSNGVITGNLITINIRDLSGIVEAVAVSFRPPTLTNEHLYNLLNQGWTQGAGWSAHSPQGQNTYLAIGPMTFSVSSGIPNVATGNYAILTPYIPTTVATSIPWAGATVISYGGTALAMNITSISYNGNALGWYLTEVSHGFLNTWYTTEGNYPANSDVWFEYKDSLGNFNPATTAANVSLGAGQSPQGHYIISAFNQDRTNISGIANLTPVTTTVRPRVGCWFQGRVWYAGVDGTQYAQGDAAFYTWTENIYFSQIVTSIVDFGECYQTNDPTDETLFAELPSDGGVIVIPGSGAIYKLFPVQNGLLVFASNGIWFIRGGQSLGFTAVDYSISQISKIRCMSPYSFVDVNGLPMFWNEEGIYTIQPSEGQSPYGFGGFTVEPITLGTIRSFYDGIPKISKQYARGTYDPISYLVQWLYRSTPETDITSRYNYDSILNLNVANRAFYPYSITGIPNIHGIEYLSYPASSTADQPSIKYLVDYNTNFTFAEEWDSSYLDWLSYDGVGTNYISSFTTGYRLEGKAVQRFESVYLYMYSNNEIAPNGYNIQGVWDYATSTDSGKYSQVQQVYNSTTNVGFQFRRHKIRGHGMALQFTVTSTQGIPFDIIGWTLWNSVDGGF